MPSSVSGIAAKGPISGGTVQISALDGQFAETVTTTTTKPDGTFGPVDIGEYNGNILITVTGGKYTDEATGNRVDNATLRTAVTGVAGDLSAATTPLTAIAVRLAELKGGLNSDTIKDANATLSTILGVSIINATPCDVLDASKAAAASADEVNYGLILAAISEMAAPDPNNSHTYDDNYNHTVAGVMAAIATDLQDATLNQTGADLKAALEAFLKSGNNKSGVDSLDETKLDNLIEIYSANPAIPADADATDVEKAHLLMDDLRATVFTMYNWKEDDTPNTDIVRKPMETLGAEMETQIVPGLMVLDRAVWVICASDNVTMTKNILDFSGETYSGSKTFQDTDTGYTLTINRELDSGTGKETVTFTIKEGSTLVDSGTLTLTRNNDDMVTNGTLDASMAQNTTDGAIAVDADLTKVTFREVSETSYYDTMTFTGTLKSAAGISLDFGQSGAGLSLTIAQISNSTNPDDIYPANIDLKGTVTTTTAQIECTALDVDTKWNSTAGPVPNRASCSGIFEEYYSYYDKDEEEWVFTKDKTGVKLAGTLAGNFVNADDFDFTELESSSNWAKWDASFEGTIEKKDEILPITIFLRGVRSGYDELILGAEYRKAKGNAVVFLTGNGIYNRADQIASATFSNQNNMVLEITYNDADDTVSGGITTSGGRQVAVINNDYGPCIQFSDDSWESLY